MSSCRGSLWLLDEMGASTSRSRGAAATLSYALRSAAKLVIVYGGFAGLVATLVFLYVSAVTLIFGAEVNAVLGERAV